MEYIGNIVTDFNIETTKFLNVTSDTNSINFSLPTLIVGWDKVKKLYPEQNILNNKINDNVTWTFSKREKRYQYEKDLSAFIKEVVSQLENKVNYRFFNFILASESKKEQFINYLKNNELSLYYNSRFLYIYDTYNCMTIGVSLRDMSYLGINVRDFIGNIKNEKHLVSNNVDDIGKDSLFIIKDNIKIMPYLNYLKNKDIYIKIKSDDKEYK
jgi:hypothetical protein